MLHAHLPYVRHPEAESWLEEDWLFEAIAEAYLPLLRLFSRLADEKIPTPVVVSLSPTLVAMWDDPLLQERFVRWLEARIDVSALEVERTRFLPAFSGLAEQYHRRFRELRSFYLEELRGDLAAAWRELTTRSQIVLATTAATHAFLPLLLQPTLQRAQIAIGMESHARRFGVRPSCFWLPECGYLPGLDRLLVEQGVRHSWLESHGLRHARPRPRRGTAAAIRTQAGLRLFGRDGALSRRVWSAGEGYPGHPDYREFHRDIAFDLEREYLAPWLHAGERSPIGIKYWKVTGPGLEKEPYDFARAEERAREHAVDFIDLAASESGSPASTGGAALRILPFDAELFGHWWYEGPVWLECLFREAAARRVRFITPEDEDAGVAAAEPGFSSWGEHGYAGYWLDRENDWIYRHLEMAGERMMELSERELSLAQEAPEARVGFRARGRRGGDRGERRRARSQELRIRALRQAARELLLAQASDWPFLMRAGTAARYAETRVRGHLARHASLYDALSRGPVDESLLAQLEDRTPWLPDLDWTLFTRSEARPEPRRGSEILASTEGLDR